jgi:hypothetical protein
MTDTEIFYGDWLVQCDQVNADFSQQFIIRGSDNADGIYNGTQGTQIARVSGQQWSISTEWNDNISSGWQSSDIKRSASYTLQEGLVIMLGADDNTPDQRDFDYDDLILNCKSLDPIINPTPPPSVPDFTISPDMIIKPRPPYPH